MADVLIDTTIILTEKNDRDHVCIPFRVESEYEKLKIECHYSPKYIKDENVIIAAVQDCYNKYLLEEDRPETIDPEEYQLKNLITISLDCNGEYLGAAHRQSPDQTHMISSDCSSVGFYKHSIDHGEWRAVISVHALKGKDVKYQLKVTGI